MFAHLALAHYDTEFHKKNSKTRKPQKRDDGTKVKQKKHKEKKNSADERKATVLFSSRMMPCHVNCEKRRKQNGFNGHLPNGHLLKHQNRSKCTRKMVQQ